MNYPASRTEVRLSTGVTAPGFVAVRNALDALLLADPAYSAQLSIYWKDQLVVDLCGGPDLESDSITGLYSVSKGIAAMVVADLVQSKALDLDERVAHYWPEFASQGKGEVTVRQLLSHQAGLVNADGGLSLEDMLASEGAAKKLADQRPLWIPGSAFGYHALTIGIFMEELVRRITGESLQERYERTIRAPRGIDLFLGVPEQEEHRYRPILPMVPTAQQAAEIATKPSSPDSLAAFAFNTLRGNPTPGQDNHSPNRRAVRAAGPSSVGAIGSARGIASVYAAALGHLGDPLLDSPTLEAMSQQQVFGRDRCLDVDNCFGIVFMKPIPRAQWGSYRAFGHDGAGGALGFADPMHDLAFGYIPMPMSYPGGADVRAVRLAMLVRSLIAGMA